MDAIRSVAKNNLVFPDVLQATQYANFFVWIYIILYDANWEITYHPRVIAIELKCQIVENVQDIYILLGTKVNNMASRAEGLVCL